MARTSRPSRPQRLVGALDGVLARGGGTRKPGPDRTGGGTGPVPVPGRDPGEDDVRMLEAVVDWGLYRDGRRVDVSGFAEACRRSRHGEGFVWIGMHEPDTEQLAELGEVFGLHPLALEDASTPRQRPRLQRYEESLFLTVRTLSYIESAVREEGGDIVETGAVMVFVGPSFVVTVRHGRHASMVGMRRRLEADPELLALGPASVLHAVTDKVVDDYLAVVEEVTEDIEEIEAGVFATRLRQDIERIYELKRDVIEMKRTVAPLVIPLSRLAERPDPLVHEEIREYFRDVADHLEKVREQVQSFDELLSSILQAGLARLSVAENEDMRKISAWVAIAAWPTMIAGIYGMNFQYMPELSQRWGYPVVMTVIVGGCLLMYRGLRRNGWL